jgi:recombination protein RecA
MTDEQKKKIEAVQQRIEKDYGKGSFICLSDKPTFGEDVVSTGSLGLDIALGIGGLPHGRIVEIFGPESSGKSTLCQHIIAEAQKAGGSCAYIDVEHSLDSAYAERLGINLDELYLSQPSNAEEGLNIADILVESGAFKVVVVDSVAALTPKTELEGEIGDSKMGVQARLMGQALRIINTKVAKSGTLLIFVNQMRMKLGVMFGSPETTPGGEALKFYASVRLDIRRKGTNKEGEQAVSNSVKVRVVKSKVGVPFKSAEFNIVFGEGIDKKNELIQIGTDLGLIDKSGSWYKYKDIKIQGDSKFKQLLVDNPELSQELEEAIKQKLND